MIDRVGPTLRPHDRPQGFQRWRCLLFLHWEVPAAAVERALPRGLDVDCFEGRAYVGVVPFTMRDVAPSWAPSVPGVSHFHELNVRTYVHHRGRDPGVLFLSLDAASSIAVVAARVGWHLPYHRATMRLEEANGVVTYTSERRWPRPTPAALRCTYRVGEEIGPAREGTFEHFLAERYILYTARGGRLLSGRVHHRPYPLARAEVLSLEQSMVQAGGLPAPSGAPHALYSPGVDVDIFPLREVGGACALGEPARAMQGA